MNGKKAKFLRREADSITIGADKVTYTSKTVKRTEEATIADPNGLPRVIERTVDRTTVHLQDTCTRKVYKGMKKVYRRLTNSGVSYA